MLRTIYVSSAFGMRKIHRRNMDLNHHRMREECKEKRQHSAAPVVWVIAAECCPYEMNLSLPGKEGVICHHGINLGANAGYVLFVFGVVENTLNECSYHGHHILLDTTGGDGRSTQTDT